MARTGGKLRRMSDAMLAMAKLDSSTCEVVRQSHSTAQAAARLEAAGRLPDAVRIYAFALPQREAVWWASMCTLYTAPADLPALDRLAREAAEKWVRERSDAAAYAAMRQARQAGFRTPECWAAVAAFWSGPSLSPAGEPAVPPAPHLTGTAVFSAISLAAVRGDPAAQNARLTRFLESAREICDGGVGRLEPQRASAASGSA